MDIDYCILGCNDGNFNRKYEIYRKFYRSRELSKNTMEYKVNR